MGPGRAAFQAASPHTSREVFGFALASSLADPTVGYPSWNFDLLSTVAFFGLHVDSTGHFVADNGWTVWNSSVMTNFVATAHQHGVRVVVSVVVQDFTSGTPNMCAALAHADVTVAQTVSQVTAKGVEGVNLDYEGLDNSCGTSDPYWAQHAMTSMVKKMRAALGASRYLSIDTYAGAAADPYGFFDVAGLAASVDSMFVMAYDLEYSNYAGAPLDCSRFCLGPTSPLTSYRYNDTNVVAQYIAAVPASKVILGVPYYGRKACVGAVGPNQYPTSGVVADSYLDAAGEATDPAVKPGSYVIHREANSSGMERWDTWFNTTLNCTRELYWDDAISLGKKYELVDANNLRGVGIWNLNYGGNAPELWTDLQSHFAACGAAAATLSPASPQQVGAQVRIAATSTGCLNPRYEFWMRPASSGTWQLVQGYSAGATYDWNSTGAQAGTVDFSVWTRDASSPAAYDSYASTPYTLLPRCTSVTASATPASVVHGAGTHVTVTAAATGCGTGARYEFWMRPASSSAWQLVQGYGPSASYDWNSTGALAGTVYFSAWVRDVSSTSAYDATTSLPYVVSPSCTSVTASAAPTSVTHGSGTHVTITAAATGCTNSPRYEFWMRPAGSSTWQLVQAYGTGSTYSWNSTGALTGTAYFSAWVRDSSSSAVYDAYASAPVTVK